MFLHICINCGTLAMASTITSAWVDLNLHKKTFITSCTWETFERRQCIKEVGTKTWERLQEGNDLLLLLQEHSADIRCLAPEALEISEGWRRRRLGGGGGAGWIIRSLFTWGNSIVEGGGREICIPNTRTTYI